jgi:TonB family protein
MVNKKENKKGRFTGVVATVLLHLLVFALCFKMIFINSTMALPLSVIEVSIEPEPEPVEIKPKEHFNIRRAVTGKKIEETPTEPTKATEIDDQSGDVEVPVEKPIPVKIDDRSLFRGQDVGAAEGTPSGNSTDSRALFVGDNDPNAGASDEPPGFDLNDRSIMGKLEQPANTSNRDGRVVVEIIVNQNGQVTRAQARPRGTTIQDAVLWKAAEDAARKAQFNVDLKSPPLQKGTITYVFKLK